MNELDTQCSHENRFITNRINRDLIKEGVSDAEKRRVIMESIKRRIDQEYLSLIGTEVEVVNNRINRE